MPRAVRRVVTAAVERGVASAGIAVVRALDRDVIGQGHHPRGAARRFRQRGQHIRRFAEPAALLPGRREHLARRAPEPERAVAGGEHRGGHSAALAIAQHGRTFPSRRANAGPDQTYYGFQIFPGKVRPFTSPRREPSTGSDHCSNSDVGYFDRRWTPNEKPAV